MGTQRFQPTTSNSPQTEKVLKEAVASSEQSFPANMTTVHAAEYLCTNTSTLADWRMKGVGPRWARAGRRVIYRRQWLDNWLDSRSVLSTAEAKRLDIR
jgi:hypothetical protein